MRLHFALILIVWSAWLLLMNSLGQWHLFSENWFMSITMMFGSFVAGATSEGGGAVAFPVMTLGYGIQPGVARDFSLMIQSVGMLSAGIAIVLMKVDVEWRAIMLASTGGVLGMIAGIELLAPALSPTLAKLFFVSFWLGFGVALVWVNRDRQRHTLSRISGLRVRDAALIVLTGIIGGLVSGTTGSGLDIVTFSLLVLYFGINEKVATPTSVVLMAINSIVGFIWKGSTTGMMPEAWGYWWVCVPVVVVGAPFGAWFIRFRSRHFVAGFLYLSITVQFLWGMLILDLDLYTSIFVLLVSLSSILFYFIMFRAGRTRLQTHGCQ